MAGVRIQHPTARSVTFTMVDGSRVYREPFACHALIVVRGELRPCARIHTHKTYHLNLDESGAVIVAPEIVARLERIPGNPFRIANEVLEPPAQRIVAPLLRILTRPIAPGART